jgi:deoxyribodipyrimidine photo-lyase
MRRRYELRTAIVLFTRDLRLHDHRGLSEAAREFERVVPLFVVDDRVLGSRPAPNRTSFLLDALADLRGSLRERGGDLVIRRGDAVEQAARLARTVEATAVFVSADASGYAQNREKRLARTSKRERFELRTSDAHMVVPPGLLAPDGSDHYRVFTPYWRRWRALALAPVARAPAHLRLPDGVASSELPSLRELTREAASPDLARGGEREGRRRLSHFVSDGIRRYEVERDRLSADATSRLSAYLHFGCVSALEVVARAKSCDDADAFVRQLCWRDFFIQLLAANPQTSREDFRPRGRDWRDDDEALARWREGRTGNPIVDAGMRQLAREGWLHNRARLIVGSFLTRTLGLDWRDGADVFFELLVDGDVASNVGNWQWVAGTGANPRPNRTLSLKRQAHRFDSDGDYVRRYVPELAELPTTKIHARIS